MTKTITIPDTVALRYFRENVEGAETYRNDKMRGRCPVCGDSATSKSKKRMYLLKHRDKGWIAYCHNCECSMSLWNLVKYYFPNRFEYLKQETFTSLFTQQPTISAGKDTNQVFLDALQVAQRTIDGKRPVEKFLDSCCYKITDPSLGPKEAGISRCVRMKMERRMLKKEIIDTLYFCYKNDYKNKWMYKNRVIIPFFDTENKVYYFQARALLPDQVPKYINWREGEEDVSKPEYNECVVNRSKPVFIVEGLIDSTFLDNAVSVLGVKISDEKVAYLESKYPKPVFILDNDISGRKWLYKLLKRNRKCFVWPKEYKDIKDLNDLALHLKQENLTEIINKSCYNGIQGLIKLSELEGKI
jgi:hypothetical protein